MRLRRIGVHQTVTIFGRGFASRCNHPLVETLIEYESNNSIALNSTTLYRYHKNFVPSNTGQAMGFEANEYALPVFQYPWGGFRLDYRGGKSRENSRFCGPSSEKLIQQEYESTISLYNDIRDSGYKLFSKRSVIGGTFLIDRKGNKRFVVLQGNHRMAVLSALGYRKAFVYTMPGYLDYIYETQVDRWSLVRENRCSRLKALKLFSAFFNGQGNFVY